MGNDSSKGGHPDPQCEMSEEEMRERKIALMDTAMTKKFQRGGSIHNMRCIIKGAPATGKSALFRRLQGKPFSATYNPTRELQSAHVNWKHKSDASTVVKVEVWDVVDKSENNEIDMDKYGERAAYYLKTGADTGSVGQVDANMIDVYRHAHAMVITSNPQQRKTFDYIKTVLADPCIAPETPIAILANFRDQVSDDSRQVSREEYGQLAAVDPRHRFVFECSSKNCYGLKELYDFLTVPFLKLQERELAEKLQSVRAEFNTISGTMSELHGSQNYDAFVQELSAASEKAKMKSEGKKAPGVVVPQQGNPMVKRKTLDEPEDSPPPAASKAEESEPENVSEPLPPAPLSPAKMTAEEQAAAVAAAVAAATAALQESVGETAKPKETKPAAVEEPKEEPKAVERKETEESSQKPAAAKEVKNKEPAPKVVVKQVPISDSSSSDSEDSDWDAPAKTVPAKEQTKKVDEENAKTNYNLNIDDFDAGGIDDDFWD